VQYTTDQHKREGSELIDNISMPALSGLRGRKDDKVGTGPMHTLTAAAVVWFLGCCSGLTAKKRNLQYVMLSWSITDS
jgi:hypothetical protein